MTGTSVTALAVAVQAAEGERQARGFGKHEGAGGEKEAFEGAADAPKGGDAASSLSQPGVFQAADAHQALRPGVAASPYTVARLASGIAKKLQAKATNFQLALEPAGLGKVDVKVRIGADGAVTAALNFDNAASAEALKARAGELRAALEQAGFSLAGQDLSFTAGGFGRPADSGADNASNGRRSMAADFAAAAEAAEAEAVGLTSAGSGGVDIRI